MLPHLCHGNCLYRHPCSEIQRKAPGLCRGFCHFPARLCPHARGRRRDSGIFLVRASFCLRPGLEHCPHPERHGLGTENRSPEQGYPHLYGRACLGRHLRLPRRREALPLGTAWLRPCGQRPFVRHWQEKGEEGRKEGKGIGEGRGERGISPATIATACALSLPIPSSRTHRTDGILIVFIYQYNSPCRERFSTPLSMKQTGSTVLTGVSQEGVNDQQNIQIY